MKFICLNQEAHGTAVSRGEYTNIWSAAYYGELPVVRHLLREEPSLLNMKQPGPGPLGSEPLIKAAQCGSNAAASLAIVELLLSKKADITVTTGSGSTALHFAADCGHGEVVKRLIAAGVSVNVKDEAGLEPQNGGSGGKQSFQECEVSLCHI